MNRVISWFIAIRWLAGACVIVTILLADLVFQYALPYLALSVTVAALLVANGAFLLVFRRIRGGPTARNTTDSFFHVQIMGDYLFLFLLVYFAGFLESPFASFFVFHVMLTGFLFPGRVVYRYAAGLVAAIAGVAVLEYAGVVHHFSLVADAATYRAQMLPRCVGLAATILITAYLITNIKGRIEEKGHRAEVELDRYRQLNRVKSNFILQVTHELRGPVAAVSGFHEMVLRGITGEIPERTRVVLEKADRRTENLLTIIDEMIDLAYMKSEEEARYGSVDINLADTVQEILRNHESHAERKGVTLDSAIPDRLMVSSSRDLLNIILGNLVNNAIKYTPPGGSVTVSAEEQADGVTLSVLDTGYGIEPEELEKVFEEFYRTRRARELERDGTGLGLPIVKRAVEALGGRIAVYSEPDKGTTFEIFVPITKQQKEGESNEAHSHHR